MLTAVEYTKNTESGRTTGITTTLFEVIAALHDEGVDDKAVVLILECMMASGRIRFRCDGAHSN